MVAVQALDRTSSALLRKAAKLARTRKCDLNLVHVIALPYAPAVSRRAGLRQAAQEIVADCKKRLLKLAASPQLRGIQTHATVTWDYPAVNGLVRQVIKHRPQLLLAQSHRHSRLARPFLSNTDWELIRNCPCPVWLSKSARAPTDGPVVAALDPLHANAKPAALDIAILDEALEIAGKPQRVLAVHAYLSPTPPLIDGALAAYLRRLAEQELEDYEATVRRELNRIVDRTPVPANNRIIVAGDPATALQHVVRKYRASLVVMGAVSRSALGRVFIGHTAERVIDQLDCDVMIVKPRGFKTSVIPRPRVIVNLPPLGISP